MDELRIPSASKSIEKGVSLKEILGQEAVKCLATNLSLVHLEFDAKSFFRHAMEGSTTLSLVERGKKIAESLHSFLPQTYDGSIEILLASLTPPLSKTEGNGLAVFFYLPHTSFVTMYGVDPQNNGGRDPFETSMRAQYELTQRFSAEFSIRRFIIEQEERTLDRLLEWTNDPNPHVRRLCSEGTRPRLPWAKQIPSFVKDPRPVLPLLQKLKNDENFYVRRSVANHLGDMAKDHPQLVFEICQEWLTNASGEMKWLIRHALRYPAKKGDETALRIRGLAKA